MTHILFLWHEERPVMLCGARVRILPDASLKPASADFIGFVGGLVTAEQARLVDCAECRRRGDLLAPGSPAETGLPVSWAAAVRRLQP